jgi:DNA-binding Lrp family transcriptional regulator
MSAFVPLRAYVLFVAKPGTSVEVVRELRKIKGVVNADAIYGRFDAIGLIEVESPEGLTNLIYNIIERIPNIVRTETCLIL